MLRRFPFVVLALMLTTACMQHVRFERPLPASVAPVTDVRSIAVIDEHGTVVLAGQFAAAQEASGATIRLASLAGSDAAVSGSATLELARPEDGQAEEALTLIVEGLSFPALYRVRVDDGQVTMFSTTTSGQAYLHLTRLTEIRR